MNEIPSNNQSVSDTQVPPASTPTQTLAKEPISAKTVLQSLLALHIRCRAKNDLSPVEQLTYRVLIDIANAKYWAASFVASDSEIAQLVGASRQAIIRAKRKLKNLGLIDFSGNPTRYIVYCNMSSKRNTQGDSASHFQTTKLQTKEYIYNDIHNDMEKRRRDNQANADNDEAKRQQLIRLYGT